MPHLELTPCRREFGRAYRHRTIKRLKSPGRSVYQLENQRERRHQAAAFRKVGFERGVFKDSCAQVSANVRVPLDEKLLRLFGKPQEWLLVGAAISRKPEF